jgi:hypothetical protein
MKLKTMKLLSSTTQKDTKSKEEKPCLREKGKKNLARAKEIAENPCDPNYRGAGA